MGREWARARGLYWKRFQSFVKNEYLKNFKIEKNHIEIGQGGFKYKFDVFCEVIIAGVSLKAAIEELVSKLTPIFLNQYFGVDKQDQWN